MRQLLADAHEMVAEQVEYRELLYQMTMRDLLLRYKQTVMGFGWAIFMPLVNTLVFSVIFTRVAHIDTGMPYPLFAYCGLLVWNFTASSLRFAVSSLTSNTSLVTKVYFPREIFPASAVLVSLVDFAVGLLVLIGLMMYYHVAPSMALLAMPLVIIVQVVFTGAIALLLAMGNLFYRDVKYLFDVVITIWMFVSSVLYPMPTAGGTVTWLLALNPMTVIIDAYRDVLLRGRIPDLYAFGVAAVFSILALAMAWLAFHRAEFQFAENV
jgi:ABC-type polysaccharide/polyol phosphate export permease